MKKFLEVIKKAHKKYFLYISPGVKKMSDNSKIKIVRGSRDESYIILGI